ncbi:hypothetical protein CR161_09320 [Prosthecochloris sp. ZM]|uniref:lamin tail domain-containing protein n=1 Tax=Prosthecochloris sp. ZM TaxID=2283143 RepID=UPI000DF7BC7A|nr:lamin tail domain-containing protein [Prosthecochloris sp. ZM]RDD30882.1 hypothetical protein CR161_09320 [Prosthecochloris sp. ZM]
MHPHHLLHSALLLFFVIGCKDYPDDAISPSGPSLLLSAPEGPVINEIHFDPRQSSTDNLADQPDYVEIYNPGNAPADLTGWTIEDCPSASGKRYSYHFADAPSPANILKPGEYAIVTPDNSPSVAASRLVGFYDYLERRPDVSIFLVEGKVFSFNNDRDCVTLKNSEGTLIDSVAYEEGWHNPYIRETKGRSIEKFNPLLPSSSPSSWTSSADNDYGGTPGIRNSVYLTQHDLQRIPVIKAIPEQFSTRQESMAFEIDLPYGAYQMSLVIYDSNLAEVRRLANGLPAGPSTILEWDGRNDNGETLASGIYIARLNVNGTTLSTTLETTITLISEG